MPGILGNTIHGRRPRTRRDTGPVSFSARCEALVKTADASPALMPDLPAPASAPGATWPVGAATALAKMVTDHGHNARLADHHAAGHQACTGIYGPAPSQSGVTGGLFAASTQNSADLTYDGIQPRYRTDQSGRGTWKAVPLLARLGSR